ncbi:aminodeoxychorismate synthase component I [Uliginosibacterium paludis]|uniref:Aminodeoxychorismate synthase component I n=1 Tax=Uliginosibacterium paludis TaxID=1615952 RepID=A0ABV2CKS4_9RHOO
MTGAAPGQPFALFENNLAHPGSARLLEDCAGSLLLSDPAQAAFFFAEIRRALASGYWLALAAHYELGHALEHSLPAPPASMPLARAWIFRRKQDLAGSELDAWWAARLGHLTPQERDGGLLALNPCWSAARHETAVRRVLAYIQAGDCYQINLTFPFDGAIYGHPLALFQRLREAQPVAHGVLIHDGTDWVLSRSPELFVERKGKRLSCRPMKGTAARHADPAQDSANAAALLASDKERAENLMIVDLIRNDLGRLTPAGGVSVARLFELETYASVFQLTSSIHAEPAEADFATTMSALFPCGSVTGAPKIRAMQIIGELEDDARGLYCGALGWLAPDGDFSLNVPIRTLMVSADRRCRLNTGSGIVADSNPVAEYQECLAKAAFARQTAESLGLIETLRWDGTRFPLLAGHLARLERSAHTLGFAHEPDRIEAEFARLQDRLAKTPVRVRLLLARNGSFEIETAPLTPLPPENLFALADWALDETDPRLCHKTTARVFYDDALKLATQRGLFDLLFCNRRGELAEGARSNLFIERDGALLTPALSCGVLPGVLRASLLKQGTAREAVLYPEDLVRADRIWLGNALRGLVEVRLQP